MADLDANPFEAQKVHARHTGSLTTWAMRAVPGTHTLTPTVGAMSSVTKRVQLDFMCSLYASQQPLLMGLPFS